MDSLTSQDASQLRSPYRYGIDMMKLREYSGGDFLEEIRSLCGF